MPRPEWIVVGRVSRPHGVRGEVRVVPDSDNPLRFSSGSILYIRPAAQGLARPLTDEHTPLTVETVRGETGFPIVAFAEIADRSEAEVLRGHVLEIRSSQLPDLDEDEFYPFDLIGLEVRDTSGAVVGRVEEVMDSPAHGILTVRSEAGSEIMIPFVSAAVPVVSLAEGYVVVGAQFLEGIAANT